VKLVYLPRARQDLVAIVDFIARDDPKAAFAVRLRIEQSLLVLQAHPMIGQETEFAGLHKWSIPGLPYAAYYGVEGKKIVIARVLHGKRKWPEAYER
jgi:plasmid stabilization system protein ParE